MEVYQVTKDYFDEDHEHGYYDFGTYASIEAARQTAEAWARLFFDSWEWKGERIVIETPFDRNGIIYISPKSIATEPATPEKLDDADKCLVITYT